MITVGGRLIEEVLFSPVAAVPLSLVSSVAPWPWVASRAGTGPPRDSIKRGWLPVARLLPNCVCRGTLSADMRPPGSRALVAGYRARDMHGS